MSAPFVDPDEPAVDELFDNLDSLGRATPAVIDKLYKAASIGASTSFEDQVRELISFVESKKAAIQKELKTATVEEVLNRAAGGRRHTSRKQNRRIRRATRRRTQAGGMGFLGKLVISLLVVLSNIGNPGGDATALRGLKPHWAAPTPANNNFHLQVAEGWNPHTKAWNLPPALPGLSGLSGLSPLDLAAPTGSRNGTAAVNRNAVDVTAIKNVAAKERVLQFRDKMDDYLKHGESDVHGPGKNVCAQTGVTCGAYPRYVMPQLDNITSFLKSARQHGILLNSTNGTRTLDEIRPSQSEALVSRVNSVVRDLQNGKLDLAKNPIIISNDGYIIDGHHRFFGLTKLGKDDVDIPVRVINAPHSYILEAAAAVGIPHDPQEGYSGLNPRELPAVVGWNR